MVPCLCLLFYLFVKFPSLRQLYIRSYILTAIITGNYMCKGARSNTQRAIERILKDPIGVRLQDIMENILEEPPETEPYLGQDAEFNLGSES